MKKRAATRKTATKKASAKKPASIKSPAKKPAAKSSSGATASAAAKGKYSPPPIEGIGWQPFRYPPQ